MTLEIQHIDLGKRGSEFIVRHPPLRNRTLFIVFLFVILTLAFSFGMHLLDRSILAGTCMILALSLLLRLMGKVHSEKVSIFPSLGLQVETTYYLGHSQTHFIHLSLIKDVVINEAVTMHSILSYLVVLLREQDNTEIQALYPLFTHSWPPASSLVSVYRSIQKKLVGLHNS